MNDLKPGVFFTYEGQPYVVLETHHLKMQQRRPVMQTKMKNMLNGKLYERNFQQSDSFEEAEIAYQNVKFLYAHRGEYWFSEENNPRQRFQISEETVGNGVKYLKANTILRAVMFHQKIINVELPIKMDFKVVEAPPAIRGDTAQGGIKPVKIETGAIVNVPLFINENDIIRLNTQSGDYVERVNKG